MSICHDIKINLIFACTFDGGIGYNNRLPWKIPSELKKFKKITETTKDPSKQNAVIMGRNTWESIGYPLSNRLNIVLTTKKNYEINNSNVIVVNNLHSAVNICEDNDIEEIYIIGGEKLYRNIFFNNHYTINSIIMSVMFYNKYNIDTYVDMAYIYANFKIQKDTRFNRECQERLFASFIAFPKKL